jgi:hypothetical protein
VSGASITRKSAQPGVRFALHRLSRNDRSFQIVFFDAIAGQSSCCSVSRKRSRAHTVQHCLKRVFCARTDKWRNPTLAALRSLLIRHLSSHPAFTVKRFTGWWTERFREYMQV